MQWGVPVLILHINVGSGLDQCSDETSASISGSQVQGCAALGILEADVTLAIQENAGTFTMVLRGIVIILTAIVIILRSNGSEMQWGVPVLILHINVGSGLDQCGHEIRPSISGSQVQGCAVLGILEAEITLAIQENAGTFTMVLRGINIILGLYS